MKRKSWTFLATIVLFAASAWAGEITGTVKWEGKAPPSKVLKMDADAVCAAHHGDEPVYSEVLVLGDGNTMGNIFVRVTKGLPDKKWDPPKEPAVMDQRGCVYIPHVLGVMVDQDVKIINSDEVLHNVNVAAKENRGFNLGMPKGAGEQVKQFSREEHMISLKCNVHPWMKAYIGVISHPFFSVTGVDGKFSIKNLPAGNYEIEAWHERAGTQTATVTVGEGDMKTVDFTFSRPEKN